ncbi:MAG: CvpA family protein [Betaproteobacteria bacterium]|nr:CvpA family protein [Betaproteobacteria bacterium]
MLGALFGLARGLLLVLAGVLLAGLTAIPRQDWWQNSILAPRFADAALALRPYLPADWAARLDYSAAGGKPAAPGSAGRPARPEDLKLCAESSASRLTRPSTRCSTTA